MMIEHAVDRSYILLALFHSRISVRVRHLGLLPKAGDHVAVNKAHDRDGTEGDSNGSAVFYQKRNLKSCN